MILKSFKNCKIEPRLCYNVQNPRDISVLDLHSRANLDLLSSRREMQLLGLMYDISKDPSYVLPLRANTRQADRITFTTEIVKCDTYQKSPFYIGTGLWNKLPADVQKKQSRAEFKTCVRKLYGDR